MVRLTMSMTGVIIGVRMIGMCYDFHVLTSLVSGDSSPSLIQLLVCCCVLASCSETLAGAPGTLFVVLPCVPWVKRQNSV